MRPLDFLSPTRHCLGYCGWQRLQSLAVNLTFTSATGTHFQGCPEGGMICGLPMPHPKPFGTLQVCSYRRDESQQCSGGHHKAKNFCCRRPRWQFQGHALRLRNRPIRRDTYEMSYIMQMPGRKRDQPCAVAHQLNESY